MRDMITPKTPIMNYSQLKALSIEELQMLNKQVVDMIKFKRKSVAMEKKFELQIGMEVKVNHPKLMGQKLVVKEIRRTKASLQSWPNGFASYSVPINMIEIV
jgi:hypothetical protein